VNPIDVQSDKTLGTSDSGVLFNYDYSGDYSSGFEGVVYSSFFSESLVPENSNFNEAEVANIEVRFAGLAKYPGYYTTSNGFLSNNMKLQDNFYYQIYSYVLKLDEQLNTYKTLVKSLLHPAGMQLFGEYELTTYGSLLSTMDLLDKIVSLNLIDSAGATDSSYYGFLKDLLDTVAAIDSKYISMQRGIVDSIALVEAGSLSRTVPGDYDNYPTESYFSPSEYYTVGTTSVITTW